MFNPVKKKKNQRKRVFLWIFFYIDRRCSTLSILWLWKNSSFHLSINLLNLLICSNEATGNFASFCDTGWTFSWTSNFAIILVHLPKPPEKFQERLPFVLFFSFSSSVLTFSIVWQSLPASPKAGIVSSNQCQKRLFLFFSTNNFDL